MGASPKIKPRVRGQRIHRPGPIRDATGKLGVTIRALAKRIGVKYDTARRWSSKGRVPPDVQQQLDQLTSPRRLAK